MARARRMLMSLVAGSLATAASALGQASRSDSAVFRGRTVRATDALAIAGVEVSFPSLDRHTYTDSTGAFRFAGLPVGLQSIQLRSVGFGIWRDTVTIEAGVNDLRVYVLDQQTPSLDTVRTIAGKPNYISPNLQAFEERRLSHAGGYFIDDSVLRQHEASTLANVVLARIPGLRAVSSNGGNSGGASAPMVRVFVSSRKHCRGLALYPCSTEGDCYVAIYLDGVLRYNAKMSESGVGPPDAERDFDVSSLAGIEFYPNAETGPVGMRANDNGCGSLWLWTRER
jgi:Carboxypeptidase regulatory-like domain